jgi:hypothetical protein
MSHFAKVENGIVAQVIVAEQDFINSGAVGDAFLWIQTSYSGSFRKQFASAGGTYDVDKDAFIPPKPFTSWTLNVETCQWEAPVAYPTDDKMYDWDEDTVSWIESTTET